MDQIDEFESIFRKADRTPYVCEPVSFDRVVLVTDRDKERASQFAGELRGLFPGLGDGRDWPVIHGDDFRTVNELLQRIESARPDVILTCRHLQEASLVPQHSLGVYLDVLTQVVSAPVLVLPGTAARPDSLNGKTVQNVMVVTDHISGDHRLVNSGVGVAPDDGAVWLCHIEDDVAFERYMKAIERIPEIDTARARELIGEQLQKEASDYIDNCISVLKEQRPQLCVDKIVDRGHHLEVYQNLIDEHGIDLLVANTKDDMQMAMHGLTYALSVELVNMPLLLL